MKVINDPFLKRNINELIFHLSSYFEYFVKEIFKKLSSDLINLKIKNKYIIKSLHNIIFEELTKKYGGQSLKNIISFSLKSNDLNDLLKVSNNVPLESITSPATPIYSRLDKILKDINFPIIWPFDQIYNDMIKRNRNCIAHGDTDKLPTIPLSVKKAFLLFSKLLDEIERHILSIY